jgi:hypothetical protein
MTLFYAEMSGFEGLCIAVSCPKSRRSKEISDEPPSGVSSQSPSGSTGLC